MHKLNSLHTRPAPLSRGAQRGVSLIELMIAMTLGLAIVAAVGYVYVSGTTGYRVQDNQSRMQEDARFIIETVSRDVRMAGYFGCARNDLAGRFGFVEVRASKPVMTLETDWLVVGGVDNKNDERFLDPSNFVRGFSAAASNASLALPNYAKLSGSLQPNTDVLLVIRAGEEQSALVPVLDSNGIPSAAQSNIAQPLPGVSDSDNVTLVKSNCEVAKIIKPTFRVIRNGAGVAASLNTDNATNRVVNDGSADEDTRPITQGVVSMFLPSIFYVAKPASAGKLPSLKRVSIGQNDPLNYGGWALNGGQIVASGVETFQTSYIVSTDIGSATATSQEVSLTDMESTPANWPNVTAVRVRFTMMSQEGGASVTQSDGKLRQSYDFTVGVRGRQYKGSN